MKSYFLLPLIIILGGLFWSGWHYYRDKHRPEPILHLFATLLLGVVSSQLAEQLHHFSDYLGFTLKIEKSFSFLFYTVFQIGFVEELCKFNPFYFICTRFKEYNELIDGLIYASMIGIGFSLEETFFYTGFESDSKLLVARAIVSPITHALFSSFFGFYHIVSLAKRSRLWLIFGFCLSFILHGVYDFFSLQEAPPYPMFASALILMIWIWRIRTFKELHRRKLP